MDEIRKCQIPDGTYDNLPEMHWLAERLNAALFDCRVVGEARAERKPNCLQVAMLEVVPPAISIAQAIFHLLRLGYIPAAHTLCRPLLEATGISNLLLDDSKWVEFWHSGWPQKGRPNLTTLISHISGEKHHELEAIHVLANEFHTAIHVTPISAKVNAANSPLGNEVYWFGPIPTATDRVINIASATAYGAVFLASNAKRAFFSKEFQGYST